MGHQMTPEDIKRLDELHAKTTRGAWYASPSFTESAYDNWPGISAELTRLREFETQARALLAAVKNSEFSGFSFEDINGVNWFDARANLDRKRGEHNES